MADSKITALTAISTVDPTADPLVIVDVSDTSMAASGTTKKSTINQLLGAGGTATLASATITGDLTVDTNVLFVNSSTNNVGLGTLTPSGASGRALEIYGGAGQSRIALKNDATGSASTDGSQIALVGSQLVIQNREASEITFETNNSERYRIASDGVATWSNVGGVAGTAMTLNATGLGVGTNPIYKLHIKNDLSELYFRDNGTASELLINSEAGARSALYFGDTVDTVRGGIVYDSTTDALEIRGYNNATRVTLDSSGNLGLSVIPSAWGNQYRALQIFNNGSLYGANAYGYYGLLFNGYNDNTNIKAISALYVGEYRYELSTGAHKWFGTTANATAGATTTPNQAMTLDASGNLLVGATSAGGNRLNVQTASGDCTTLIKSQAANVNSAIDYVSNYGNHTIRKSGAAVWDFGVINDSSATPAFKVSNASAVGVQLVSGATSWTTLSDEAMKDIIEPISNAVAKVGSLRSVIGKFKTDDASKRRSFLIAQDVQSVLPEAVDVIGENNELGLRYTEVIPLLVAAIKELTARVQTLEAK